MKHVKVNIATNKLDNLLHILLESTTDKGLTLKRKSRLAVFFFSTVIHCFPLPIVTAFHAWALLIVVAVLQLSELG
jgi:hypothetical protein